MRVQSVNLNLIPTGVMPIVHLSQYDRDADGALLFNIFNGPAPFNLTGCTATINGTKPDGNVYTYPCTVHSNFLTSAVYDQMTTVQGTHEAEIRLSDGDSVVGTLNFQMAIEKAGVSEIDVSHTDVPALLENIQASVDEAEYWAEQAASSVTGVASFNGRGGSVLPMAGDYNSDMIPHTMSSSIQPIGGIQPGETVMSKRIINALTSEVEKKSDKTDLTSIIATGSTNATGSTIVANKYFYLNGTLVRAKTDIAIGATFTENTNYEVVTAGGLNAIVDSMTVNSIGSSTPIASGTPFTCPSDGLLSIYIYNGKSMDVKANNVRVFDVKNVAGTGQTYGVTVRKGMIISCTFASSDGSLAFFPFI